jgi:tetratricopeptide (TPR) repeat protein
MNQPLTSQEALQRANQHSDAGRLAEAEQLYRQILAREPNNSSALHGLGIVALRARQFAPAIDLMNRSLQLSPQTSAYWTNLANAYRSANRLPESLGVLLECVRRFPTNVIAYRDLGSVYGLMGRMPESAAACEQALRLRAAAPPSANEASERKIDARVYINLGAALVAMGKVDEAIAAHDKALQLDPDSAVAHMNRGHMLFRQGRLPEAFADYEWRWKIADFTHQWPSYPQPAWDGSDLGGRTVLLWHEQGMGDTIQFARYAPMVEQRGGKAIIWSQAALTKLLQTLDPPVQIASSDGPLPPFDLHLPLLSLPRIFGTTRDSIPRAQGYLKADPELVEQWKQRLKKDHIGAALRVGIVWSGSTGFVDNKNRSLSLSALAPILAVEGVQFFSLQKGEPAEQLKTTPTPRPVIDLGPELSDFAQTAALLKNLDFLITVDTGPAHLAGAIGSEVWTMLCQEPDFRWLWDTDRSSWYSSMRLFRQPKPGDWPHVVDRVARELAGRVQGMEWRTTPHITLNQGTHAAADMPQSAAECHNAALAEHQQGKHELAIQLMRRAIELNPLEPSHWRGLAMIHRDTDRPADAADSLRQATQRMPGNYLLHRDLGLALKLSGDNAQAVSEYQTALALHHPNAAGQDPQRFANEAAEIYVNLGVALHDLGREDEALVAADKAVALNPNHALAHLNRILPRFRRGDVRGGFADYEWRWADSKTPWPVFAQPRWDGSNLQGKTILLWNEQGLGDSIQFARFVPMVAARGGRPIIRCQRELARLFRSLPGAEKIVSDGDPLPGFDLHAPLMSLAHLLDISRQTLLGPHPYLFADAGDVEAWRARLAEFTRGGISLRVGIVWAGSKHNTGDQSRSIPLAAMAPILAVPGVQFFSLQKGESAEQLKAAKLPAPLLDLGPQLNDFADTAALLKNLDLLITADTSPAHLAGAIGSEVWTMLSTVPEFRWVWDTDRSSWYPNMRLYRQPKPGDWAAVSAQVAQELRKRVQELATVRLPKAADISVNSATTSQHGAKETENFGAADRAIQLNLNHAVAYKTRLFSHFRRSDFRSGFAEYESRWIESQTPWPNFTQPKWGGSDLTGKRILLWNEQGCGDMIQFARFVPLVAARGGKPIIRCQRELVRLFRSLQGVDQVVADGDALPMFDLHAPLMSLGHLLDVTRQTLNKAEPYLFADSADVQKFRDRLAELGAISERAGYRVGIVWSGSNRFVNNQPRSLSLQALTPILGIDGVQFFSLQKGEPAAQLKTTKTPQPVIDMGPELRDFADTAALLKNLDLLITVDTAPAHVGGAVGCEVWTMLSTSTDFRWAWDTDRSSWYPNMRLFRQPQPGDWASVLAQVAQELKTKVAASAGAFSTSAPTPIWSIDRSFPSPGTLTIKPPPQPSPEVPEAGELDSMYRAGGDHHAAGRIDQAEALYRQVLERQPNHASALHHLGLIAFQRGQNESAMQMMRRSIELDPGKAFFHKNLATAARASGNAAESAQLLQKAIELSAPDPLLLEELGVTLERLDRLDESVAAYQQAIALLDAGSLPLALKEESRRRQFEAKLHSNLGAALERQNHYEPAMAHFEQAIALNPQYGMAHMHRASVLFRRSDLSAAFAEYEWRFATKGFPTRWRNYPHPPWDGSDLNGRTILLWPEQGLGDTIQFARFAPLLAERGAKVIVQCMPPLKRVLQTLGKSVMVVSDQEALPAFDVHLPLISLPRALRTTYESLPAPQSYLHAEPELAAEWRNRLEVGSPGLRVGLVWSGSPDFPANRRRSIPPEALPPLMRISGTRFFSLQMGEAAKQLASVSPPQMVTDLSGQIHDFADSAAILSNLDLLISTDTAIVHLAGALGIPAWVMLWSERDWRWLMDDQRMPWYPSVRPFLQPTMGKWDDVVQRIGDELRKLCVA